MRGVASSAHDERRLRISVGEAMLWSGRLADEKPAEFRFGFVAPPGETLLRFQSDQPPRKLGADPRPLAFKIKNLEIVVHPADDPR